LLTWAIEGNSLHFPAANARHVLQASIVNQNSNTTSVIADTSIVNNINWVNNVIQTTDEQVSAD